MAQLRGLSRGTTQVGSLPLPSGTKRRRLALSFAVAGALSFWLPDAVVHIEAGPNFDSRQVWLCTILMPATFLLAYVVARRLGMKRDFKWVGPAMKAVHTQRLFGGLSVFLAVGVSNGGVHIAEFAGFPHGFRLREGSIVLPPRLGSSVSVQRSGSFAYRGVWLALFPV